MNSFYVHLPSNVHCSSYENKASYYITHLAQTLHLDGNWEVGLCEIIYCKSWYNINNDQKIRLLDETGELFGDDSIKISEGFYPDAELLVADVNSKLRRLCYSLSESIELATFTYPMLIYDKKTMKITEQFGEDLTNRKIFKPLLEEELAYLLGVTSVYINDPIRVKAMILSEWNYSVILGEKIIKEAEKEVRNLDINAGINTLFVYSDIVKPSLVGNSLSKILRKVQIPGVPFSQNVQTIFERPFYVPIASNEIRSIEINIKDDTGENIKFRSGKVVCVLHFRKK